MVWEVRVQAFEQWETAMSWHPKMRVDHHAYPDKVSKICVQVAASKCEKGLVQIFSSQMPVGEVHAKVQQELRDFRSAADGAKEVDWVNPILLKKAKAALSMKK